MSKRLNELAEAVLDRVYTYGYQQRAVEEEKCKADDDLLAAQRKLAEVTAFGDKVIAERDKLSAERDKLSAEIETLKRKLECSQQQAAEFMQTIDENNDRLTNAEELVWPGRTHGDDAPSIMAGEILDLRNRVTQLYTVEADLLNDNMTLRAQLAVVERDRDHWREARRLAIEAGDLMRAEIETLRGQLAEAGDNAELERLRAFAAAVRASRKKWSHFGGIYYAMRFTVDCDLALDELDAANPAPASEPTGGAE